MCFVTYSTMILCLITFKLSQPTLFLTAIWLPHGQHWAIIEGTASLTDVSHYVLHFRPEAYQEPHNEVGFLSLAKHLVRFEPGTFRFLLQHLNPLGHSP